MIKETIESKGSPYFTQQSENYLKTTEGFEGLSEEQKRVLLRYGQAVCNFFGRVMDRQYFPKEEVVRDVAFKTMIFREKQAEELHGIPHMLVWQMKREAKGLLREMPKGGIR